MILNDSILIDAIWCDDNYESEEDYEFGATLGKIDSSKQSVRDYLNRIVKHLPIKISKSKYNDEFMDKLTELLKICNNLEKIEFSSLGKEINIDNEIIDILLSKKDLKELHIKENINIDFNHLLEAVNKSDNQCKVYLDHLPTREFELSYLKEQLDDKIYVSYINDELLKKINISKKRKVVDINLYEQYSEFYNSIDEFDISINNIGQIDIKKLRDLAKDNRIKRINIGDDYYSFEEYELLLHEVDNIISKIKMPNNDNPSKQKIIFAQLYKLLGEKITYDHLAISNEKKFDYSLNNNCRNLRNGLLGTIRDGEKKYTCVCAGYACILQNICSVLNIDCYYISSNKMNNCYQEENSAGHAYNSVIIDGQAYFCDLTWDSPSIRTNGVAQNFLKSYDDFYLNHKRVGFDEKTLMISQDGKSIEIDKSHFLKSISQEEQLQLFATEIKGEIEEMISIGYLGGFVERFVDYVKECKNELETKDLFDILRKVRYLEKYVLSDEFRQRKKYSSLGATVTVQNGNKENSKNITFYNPLDDNIEELIQSVERRNNHGK